MAYITNADIQTRLGTSIYVQLTDDNADGTADSAVVDEARIAAEGELESYLAVRYATPIDLVVHPDLAGLLKSAALDLVEYRLRLRRPPVSDDARRRHEQTVNWLRGIADGTAALPSQTTPAGPATMSVSAGEARLLTRAELADH